MGSFDLVVTSTVPRAFETAIAMGFAVDEQNELLSILGDKFGVEIKWDAGFTEFGRVAGQDGTTAHIGRQLAALWLSIVKAVPEGGSALVITHGGIVEAGAVGCLPEADHAAWGPAAGYCEGIRLTCDGARFTEAEILRVGS